ncbi:phosphotransferase [Hazenella sp. IB182357]|uniref:Phosphotransferase n=1 Tax=Polycladospora coralii TaxID=2771432 RepID=A0A926N5G2_9BACL|nr:phosphotransferase [Polycladospora coralii]MBD1371749.1 phosphotransferase [Polycladospora coralii]
MEAPDYVEMEKLIKSEVHHIKPYRRNWCIDTGSGKWIAKKIANKRYASWWLNIDQELRLRGFQSMLTIQSDDQTWFLTPFIESRTGNYSNKNDIKKMISTLARFHHLGRGLKTPPVEGASFLLYHRLYYRLLQFYQVMCNMNHFPEDLSRILRRVGEKYYKAGVHTWKRLSHYPIIPLTNSYRMGNCLAHRDLASHNWIVDHREKVWLIDFETADYDLQLGDYFQISTRMLAENDWDMECLNEIMQSYESFLPLTTLEKKIYHILLSFPNEFYRESIGLAKRKAGYNWDSSLHYLHKISNHFDRWNQAIARLNI